MEIVNLQTLLRYVTVLRKPHPTRFFRNKLRRSLTDEWSSMEADCLGLGQLSCGEMCNAINTIKIKPAIND